MTHDELLQAINDKLAYYTNNNFGASGFAVALRAIVELHKPIEEDGKLWCKHESCYNHIEFLERNDCDCSYPCPTIQAILQEIN